LIHAYLFYKCVILTAKKFPCFVTHSN